MLWSYINQKKEYLYTSTLLNLSLNKIIMWLPCFPSVDTNKRVGQLNTNSLTFFLCQRLKEKRRKPLYAMDNTFWLWLTTLVLSSGSLKSCLNQALLAGSILHPWLCLSNFLQLRVSTTILISFQYFCLLIPAKLQWLVMASL